MNAVLRYLILPSGVSAFEARYLQRMNRVALAFFWAHLPVFMLVAWGNDTGVLAASVLTTALLAGPTVAIRVASGWSSGRNRKQTK